MRITKPASADPVAVSGLMRGKPNPLLRTLLRDDTGTKPYLTAPIAFDHLNYLSVLGRRDLIPKFSEGRRTPLDSYLQWDDPANPDQPFSRRSSPPVFSDPLEGISSFDPGEWKREDLCVYVSLKALQYVRWLKSEANNPHEFARYPQWSDPDLGIVSFDELIKDITFDKYVAALDGIIARFGESTFTEIAKRVIYGHLIGLHAPLHTPTTPYQPHSDSNQYIGHLPLIRELIGGAHPVPDEMHGHVVNEKSLFGDEDFWLYLRVLRPNIFNDLVDYIKSLPVPFEQTNYFVKLQINPVALLKHYFAGAYEMIHSARPDFDTNATKEDALITAAG